MKLKLSSWNENAFAKVIKYISTLYEPPMDMVAVYVA